MALATETNTRSKVKCQRCHREWHPYKNGTPKRCRYCSSYTWNREIRKPWNKGLTQETDERVASYVRKLKGRPHPSGEQHPMFGKHHTEETKRKIGQSRKGRYTSKGNPFFGKHHSQATKQIIATKSGEYWNDEQHRKQAGERLNKRRHTIRRFHKEREPKVCPQCKITFIPKNVRQEYCCCRCVTDARKGMKYPEEWCLAMCQNIPDRSGERNPRWLGGISFEPYGLGFTKTLKAHIRERDDHTCQLCGTRENGRLLNVHHIDYSKTNHNITNLISLCDACHSKVNTNREYWQNYFTQLLADKGYIYAQ